MKKTLLDLRPVSRTRRNHALEHATIHVLSKKFSNVMLAGMSSPSGFTLIGDVSTEDVAEGAIEALRRLREGQSELALHNNCGTNFAITGIAAGMAAWLGTLGSGKEIRRKLERLPLIILLATIAIIATRPLGPLVQKEITTDSDPGGLEIERVETSIRLGMRMHRVITRG